MAGDYSFSKKPWRMTKPPHNKSQWLPGFEGVDCRLETDSARIAILAREATHGDIFGFEITDEIYESTLAEIIEGKILGAALEVPAFGFVLKGSRSTMDQLLRLRESAGASHTTRDNDFRDFNIIVPSTIHALAHWEDGTDKVTGETRKELLDEVNLFYEVEVHIKKTRELYAKLIDSGKVPPQDARYVALPMGYQGTWLQIMNLRAFIKMAEQRLCQGQTQHESNYLVRLMRDQVVACYPWTDKMLRSSCEKKGKCTEGTMLFPPCGAFADVEAFSPGSAQEKKFRLSISKFDPEKHLYPAELNSGMQFVAWDMERNKKEKEFPDIVFSMAGPPEAITDRRGEKVADT